MSILEKDILEQLAAMGCDGDGKHLVFGQVSCSPHNLPSGFRCVPADPGKALESLLDELKTLREMVLTDPLTTLSNRRAFDRDIKSFISKAVRGKSPFSMVMVDIDHFKDVNDTHGHDSGDMVLVEISARIRGAVRPEDGVYRLGGEELGILVEGDEIAGRVVADRIMDAIRRTPFYIGESVEKISVTASAGLLFVPEASSANEVYRQTDSLLYRAKTEGRNRIRSGTFLSSAVTKEEKASLFPQEG